MQSLARFTLITGLLAFPFASYAAFQQDVFEEASRLDDGGCATATFNRGIGAGFNAVAVALQGFSATYTSTDHHIRRESARITGFSYNRTTGNLAVSFEVCHHDQNSDDDFTWFVRYTVLKEV